MVNRLVVLFLTFSLLVGGYQGDCCTTVKSDRKAARDNTVTENCFKESSKVPPLDPDTLEDSSFCLREKGKLMSSMGLDEEQWNKFRSIYYNIISQKPLLIKVSQDQSTSEYAIAADLVFHEIQDDLSYHEVLDISKESDGYTCYFRTDFGCYPWSKDLDTFVEQLDSEEQEGSEADRIGGSPVEDRLFSCSCKCKEPVTKEEYIKAAQKTISSWLDSLKSEKGRYYLGSYQFEKIDYHSSFIAAGMVNGAKEFVVFACFTAGKTADEDTVDSAFNSNSSYDTFYHAYFGPCIYARYRWKDGVCQLIDYARAYDLQVSDELKEGLHGIKTANVQYPTFFDFLADKAKVKSLLNVHYDSDYPMEQVLSHNVMMLSDGTILYADIGYRNDSYIDNSDVKKKNGKVYAKMTQEFHDEFNPTYSSPVVYNEAEMDPQRLWFTPDFKLVFDDYNGDGNPDYAVKISEDKNGSTYDVRCMGNDGRPWEANNTVYVAGHFEDSLRLQMLDRGVIAVPTKTQQGVKLVENHIFSGDYSKTYDKIDNYRMYSERSYMPDDLRYYSIGTKSIRIDFWNNTKTKVKAGGNYRIERLDGDQWKKVASGTCKRKDIKAGSMSQFSINTSKITYAKQSEYRVVMKVNGKMIYGNFYMGDEESHDISITCEKEQPAKRNSLTFHVKNDAVTTARISGGKLLKDGKLLSLVDITEIKSIESGREEQLVITKEMVDGVYDAGNYTLVLNMGNEEFFYDFKLSDIPEEQRYYFGTPKAEKLEGDGLKLTLTNQIWNKTDTKVGSTSDSIYVLKDNQWKTGNYITPEDDYKKYYDADTTLKWNQSMECQYRMLTKEDYLQSSDWVMEQLEELYQTEYISKEQYDNYQKMDAVDLINLLYDVHSIESGDLCYIEVKVDQYDKEKVYFVMP